MTEKEKPAHLEGIISKINEIEEIQKLKSVRPDNRSDKREAANKALEAADKQLRRYAHKYATEFWPDFNSDIKPEDLDRRMVDGSIETGMSIKKNEADTIFYENLDSIVDSEIPDDTLDKLMSFAGKDGVPQLLKSASDKNKKVLMGYLEVQRYEDLKDSIEKTGKGRNDEDNELISRAVIVEAARAQSEKLKNASPEYRALGENLARLGAQLGYLKKEKVKEYALKGIDQIVEETKKRYESAGDYKTAIRETVKSMAKGTREEFETSLNMVYSAMRKEEKKSK